jgi:hypothetical protein
MLSDGINPDGTPRSAVTVYETPGSVELYDRLSAGLALHVASWLDLPVRLTLHMRPVGEMHSVGAVLVGLRWLFP